MGQGGLKLFIQILISGFAAGAAYALVALGFVLIYKGSRIINFAQGELMMLGSYVCFSLITQFHLNYGLAFFLTLIFSALLGFIIEFTILRPMVGKPLFSIVMITIGLGFLMRSSAAMIWTHEYRPFPIPDLLSLFSVDGIYQFKWLSFSKLNIITIIVSFILLAVFLVFFKYSKEGTAMRATANNQYAALLTGIKVRRIFGTTWAISCIVSAIAGILLAWMTALSPALSNIGLKAFPIAVLGGLESIPGAVLGGLIIGITENLAAGYLDQLLGGGIKEVTAFVILVLVLMVKPYGLFGTEEIERL